MKLTISSLGTQAKEKYFEEYDETTIKNNILQYCIDNKITKCNFRIEGEAECHIILDNNTKLTALFG